MTAGMNSPEQGEARLISEAEDILTMKELRDWANSPSTSKDIEVRIVDDLHKKVMNLRLDIMSIKGRLFELERKLDSNKN